MAAGVQLELAVCKTSFPLLNYVGEARFDENPHSIIGRDALKLVENGFFRPIEE
jgi:hypothetical protein